MALAAGVEGEDCATSVLFAGRRHPELARAVQAALAGVAEASLLTDVEVTASSFVTGLYDRRCVRVRGTAATVVRQMTIRGHGQHRGHH